MMCEIHELDFGFLLQKVFVEKFIIERNDIMSSLKELLKRAGSRVVNIAKVLPKPSKKRKKEEENSYTQAEDKLKEMKNNCLERGKLFKEPKSDILAFSKRLVLFGKAMQLLTDVKTMKELDPTSKEFEKGIKEYDDCIKDAEANDKIIKDLKPKVSAVLTSAKEFQEKCSELEGFHENGNTEENKSFDFLYSEDADLKDTVLLQELEAMNAVLNAAK